MKMASLDKLLEGQLKDLYSAENQLVKALPRIAKKAASKRLKSAITSHLQETKQHVERLDNIGQTRSALSFTGKKCERQWRA